MIDCDKEFIAEQITKARRQGYIDHCCDGEFENMMVGLTGLPLECTMDPNELRNAKRRARRRAGKALGENK